MNELGYIFSWLLIVVAMGIGWYIGFPVKKSLENQSLQAKARCAKFIGYSYMLASVIVIVIYIL